MQLDWSGRCIGVMMQAGAPEVVAGIAQQALTVIHDASEVQRHCQSSGDTPSSHVGSNSQGGGSMGSGLGGASMGGGSSAVYSQGPSQGVGAQDKRVPFYI